MKLALEPLLASQRRIYDLPAGRGRFEGYLDLMTAGSDDLELPLSALNPMGKPHVAETLDALIALDAEGIARRAVEEAQRRLSAVDDALRVGLVQADDLAGGWTNRHTVEMASRFGRSGELNRGWVVVLLWTARPPTAEEIESEVLSSIYRSLHRRRHGQAGVLAEMLEQEGRAALFAGVEEAGGEVDEHCRRVIGEHLASDVFPIQVTCLYGDEIAASLGYRGLGLPHRAGYRLALERARAEGVAPEAAL